MYYYEIIIGSNFFACGIKSDEPLDHSNRIAFAAKLGLINSDDIADVAYTDEISEDKYKNVYNQLI